MDNGILRREDIVKELNVFQKKVSELRNRLDEFDKEERLKKANSYLGKYYIASEDALTGYIRCLYVYSISEECIPNSVIVTYFNDSDAHFSIEFYSHFNPGYYDDEDNWSEISKQEFENHYERVQELIKNSINSLVQ